MRRKTAVLAAFILLAGCLGACGVSGGTADETTREQRDVISRREKGEEPDDGQSGGEPDNGGEQNGESGGAKDSGKEKNDADGIPAIPQTARRQTPLNRAIDDRAAEVTPAVEPYTVSADLSNIDNLWQFYIGDGPMQMLAENGFVVNGGSGDEFFEVYETNRYEQKASFVTVDSLMHTYHLYFSYLMKNLEKGYLSDSLLKLSRLMLEDSAALYEDLKGSEWESAARRNVAFFTVGAKLLDDGAEVNADVKDLVDAEIGHIMDASEIAECGLTGGLEDYSQYRPRGYYEGDEQLERYFRAMMWYGRIHFEQETEDLDRSALLITMALAQDDQAHSLWQSVYDVTSFFAGASDDLCLDDYLPVLAAIYGNGATAGDLAASPENFDRFHSATSRMSAPRINSVPAASGEGGAGAGFRFMGQRFTIDADIMQQLVFDHVGENAAGDRRMLPDVLDVPAALGSDLALDLLEKSGASGYAGYSENMNELRDLYSGGNETLWSSSLYSGWMNTLRPLLEVKGDGYPFFMQSEEWALKDLECFAGSYTELKHDTVLYTKQVMAEMGGGDDQRIPDDRGYVEPEPLVYARFADLSDRTAEGLAEYGMLTDGDKENLSRLSQMAETLLEISKKELRDETLTDDEYEFIRGYGGSLEHFWIETVKDPIGDESVSTRECPASLVVDVATDPGGQVLEIANATPSLIQVVVKVDGKIKLAQGSVYSFYQFPWPLSDRLTDSKWQQMLRMEIEVPEGSYYKPDWTYRYRYRYEWE